jgi:hypothetical protein
VDVKGSALAAGGGGPALASGVSSMRLASGGSTAGANGSAFPPATSESATCTAATSPWHEAATSERSPTPPAYMARISPIRILAGTGDYAGLRGVYVSTYGGPWDLW